MNSSSIIHCFLISSFDSIILYLSIRNDLILCIVHCSIICLFIYQVVLPLASLCPWVEHHHDTSTPIPRDHLMLC